MSNKQKFLLVLCQFLIAFMGIAVAFQLLLEAAASDNSLAIIVDILTAAFLTTSSITLLSRDVIKELEVKDKKDK